MFHGFRRLIQLNFSENEGNFIFNIIFSTFTFLIKVNFNATTRRNKLSD